MHNAPSVTYPVGRSRLASSLLGCLWLCGVAAALLWGAQLGRTGWRMGAMIAALAAVGLFAAVQWWRSPSGLLAWNGETWTLALAGEATPGSMRVALDLQRTLLLHWRDGDEARWLWLDRTSRPDRWDDLRRAVHSRVRTGSPADSPEAAALP